MISLPPVACSVGRAGLLFSGQRRWADKACRCARRAVLALVAVVAFSGCGPHGGNRQYDPSQVDFRVSYNGFFEGRLYPSLLMGADQLSDSSYALHDAEALFSITVTAPTSNAVLRISIDSTNLNYVTIMQEVLPVKGMRYTFYPMVKWKYDKLYRLRQQGKVDFTFTCYINDEEVDVKNVRLNYRSANECLLSVRDDSGHNHDFRWMFAAYVNEEHPYIDSILNAMLHQGVVNTITGYQKNAASVVAQVEAIWYYALEHGITYSSISCTSNASSNANVQHIRFFDEVYNSRQANCIDACVFFASIMRKIGLKPVIFVEPCHAYLGYYTDRGRKHINLLETTITSWVDFPALTRNYNETMANNPGAVGRERISDELNRKYCRYLTAEQVRQWESGAMTIEQFKRAVAHHLFEKATAYHLEQYNANRQHFASGSNMQYQQLDVEMLRKIVCPIAEPY